MCKTRWGLLAVRSCQLVFVATSLKDFFSHLRAASRLLNTLVGTTGLWNLRKKLLIILYGNKSAIIAEAILPSSSLPLAPRLLAPLEKVANSPNTTNTAHGLFFVIFFLSEFILYKSSTSTTTLSRNLISIICSLSREMMAFDVFTVSIDKVLCLANVYDHSTKPRKGLAVKNKAITPCIRIKRWLHT